MLHAVLLLAVLSADSSKMFITAASGVRLRATAAADGAEVTRLPICTVLKEIEAAGVKVSVAGQEGVWEHLEAPDGKQGWMFSPGLRAIDPAKPEETYLALAAERAAKKGATFPERADLYNCLRRAATEGKDPEATAKLQLARFKHLDETLKAIGMNSDKQPFKGFLKQYESDVVYSEPAGEWFVRTDNVWQAEKTHHATASGEPLAWFAAELPLPGECEGYLGCSLAKDGMMGGEYLRRHSSGAHAKDALKGYTEYTVENAFVSDLTKEDIPDIIKQIDEAVTLVKTAPDSPQRKKAEAALAKLRAAVVKAKKSARSAAE